MTIRKWGVRGWGRGVEVYMRRRMRNYAERRWPDGRCSYMDDVLDLDECVVLQSDSRGESMAVL